MDDDFNTGGAIGVLFDLVRTLNKSIDDDKLELTANEEQKATLVRNTTTLKELCATLGLFLAEPEEKSDGNDALSGKLMELLIELRADAKKAKNFTTADTIRDRLKTIGVVLEDRPGGKTDWSVS